MSNEDNTPAECNDVLFGAEAEHARAENLGRTVRWLIEQLDRIHLALCPGQNGTWQVRVQQAVEAAEKAPGGKLENLLRVVLGLQPEDQICLDQTPQPGSILIQSGSSRRCREQEGH